MLLLLAAALVYLGGNASVGIWDRDEPRYAQSSWQMLSSGDWVVPRFGDEWRAKKPPLIYWCQASAMALGGDSAFAARLPSVIAMLLTLGIVAVAVRRVAGEWRGIWTTFILASCLWVICLAKIALTDSVMLLWTTIALICIYRIWRSWSESAQGWGEWVALGIATGLGVLTKGPIILLTLGGTAGALALFAVFGRRRLSVPARAIGQLLIAFAIVAAVVGPWLYLVSQRAPGFLTLMTNEGLGHVKTGMEGHGGFPGQQFAMIWITFMPWSLLLPMAMVMGWKRRAEPATRFALAASLGPWVLLETCIKTKLPHYMLPTFPALAFLTAGAIEACLANGGKDVATGAFLFAAGVWAVAIAMIGCLPWVAAKWFGHLPWLAMGLVTVAMVGYAAVVLTAFHLRRARLAFVAMGVGMLAAFAVVYSVYLPRADFLRLSMDAGRTLRAAGATTPGAALMFEYQEPSLVFYQGGTIRPADFRGRKTNFLAMPNRAQWPKWMVLTGQEWLDTEPASRSLLTVVARFHGLAYADGARVEDILIVEYPEKK